MKAKHIFLFILFVVISTASWAQQDFIMYNLHEIPQSGYSNPSNRFNGKLSIGIPGVSSNYFSLSNSGFAYSDLITKDGDSLLLDFPNLLKELEDEEYLSFNAKVDLFSFGLSLSNRTQLFVNVTENFNARLSYTKDLIEFVYRGNGAAETSVSNFDGIGVSLNHYREYGVGLSHQLTQKLRLGAKIKYLYGMRNIYSKKTDIGLITNPETFAVTAQADVEIQTSNINADVDKDYFLNQNNNGMGLDLGGHYEHSEKLSFNASIIDLGFISWNSNTKNYSIENGEYTYDGIEIDAFADDNNSAANNNETSFDRVLDSIESDFNVVESEGRYSTALTSRFYLGANYKLNEQTLFGGIIQSEIFQGDIRPAFSASVNRKIKKWFTLSASYTVINRSYNNIGFGGYLSIGPVQLYMVSDNFSGAFQPQHARHAQTRFGMNLIFGGTKTTELHPSFSGADKKAAKKEKKKKEKKAKEEKESDS